MKKAKVAVVVAIAASLGLAACSSSTKAGGGGSTPSIATSSIQKQYEAEDPTLKPPAADVPGAKKGGTITVLSQSTPNSFDPTDIYYTDSNEIAKLIYRTPTQFEIVQSGPDAGKATLVPDLMDLGTPSADGLTWTFKFLYPGKVKYQDGTPVTIQDFEYAVERSFAHDLFPDGPTYQLTYFKGASTYKFTPGTVDTNAPMVSVQGNDTLIINLSQKFSDLPYYLTFPVFTPIPASKDTDPANYQKNPETTGPYKVDSLALGSELKLSKNSYWDPNTDPVRHQYADAFDFKWGGDDVTSQNAILAGATPVDQTSIDYGNIDSSLVAKVTNGGPNVSQLVTGDSPCTIVMQLDTRKIPLDVRKAIAIAYPSDQIYQAGGGSPLTEEPASTILPPSVPGYNKYTPYPGLTGTGTGDPAAAKQMLQAWEKANNKTSFTVSWYYDNTQTIAQQVNQIRTQALQQAGFTVKAIGVTTADLRSKTADYSAPVNMGQSPAGWCSDWPTGGSWFPVLFESSSLKAGLSWGMMSDPTLDAQINAVGDLPADQQPAAWGKLDQQIMGQYVVIPRYYDKAAIVEGTGLGGDVIDSTVGMPDFLNMYVK